MAEIPELSTDCPSGVESILRNLANDSFSLRCFGAHIDLKGRKKRITVTCGSGTQGLIPQLLIWSEDAEAL